ncbi:MAG TPA: hypothetical protein VGB07_28570 [Blastocatellia bacterium]
MRERNAILTEQKSAAQLEKDILAIQFPQSAATPLEGKTTVSDNSAIESQAVTYQALARAADRMICHFNWLKGNSSPQTDSKVEYPCEIKPASSTKPLGNLKKLVIYEGNEMDQFMAYGIAKERLRLMGEEYDKILAPPPRPGGRPETLSPIAPFSIARSFLGAVVDLSALLRTNVEIKGVTVSLEKESLISEVFRAANEHNLGAELYSPARFPLNIDVNASYNLLESLEKLHATQGVAMKLVAEWTTTEKAIDEAGIQQKSLDSAVKSAQAQVGSAKDRLKQLHAIACPALSATDVAEIERLENLLTQAQGQAAEEAKTRLRELRQAKCRHWSVATELQIEDAESSFVSLAASHKKLNKDLSDVTIKLADLDKDRKKLQQKLKEAWRTDAGSDEAITRLAALNGQFDQFVTALARVDNASGLNLLTSYLKTERMSQLVHGDSSYWLQLSVVKAGGNNRIKTNLLVDVFTGGNRVSHSGGAVIQYVLYNSAGKAIAADTIPAYTGYIKSKKVEAMFK